MLSRRLLGTCLTALVWMTVAAANAAAAVAPSGKIDAWLQQAEQIKSSDPKVFQQLLQQLQQARELATTAQREHIEYLIIYDVAFQGQYEKATTRAHALIGSTQDPEMKFRTGVLIANTATLGRQFTESLRLLETTLTLVDQVKSRDLRHQGLGVAAFTYGQVGQHQLALRYAERILEDAPQPRTQCFANQVKFEALNSLGTLPGQDDSILQAIEQCKSQHEIAAVNTIRVTLAKKWANQGKRSAAIDLLRSNLQEVEATRFAYLIAQVKALIAELLLDKGDLGAAESFASDTIAQGGSDGNMPSLASAYRTMYRIAEARDDSDQALVYFRRYAEVDKAYLNEVKARELAYQIVRQETLEKSQQIQRLDSQNQLLKLQRKVEQQAAQNTRLIIVLLVLLLATIAYWAYKTKRVQMSLKHLAETDALTGICNRHHFTQLAERTLKQCERNGEEVAVIMFDLDHFKSINDRFGHPAGDWVLRQVALVCQSLCRRIDVLGRLGGEEFALLMYGCDLRSAIRLAEDCRSRLIAINTLESGHSFSVTASFGVTSTAVSGYILERLLSDADRMLYRSKELGRNRVSAYRGRAGEREEANSGADWPDLAEDSLVGQAGRSFGHVR
nr:GGDEF domain-containing protein [Pseudoxanthomonas sp.]